MAGEKVKKHREDKVWLKVEEVLLSQQAADLLERLHQLGWDNDDTGHALLGMDPFERVSDAEDVSTRARQLTGLQASPEEYISAYKAIDAFLKPHPYAETMKRLEKQKLHGKG